ncbi:hypothetical protein HanIR_Chr15g0760551 [Helianthus annuus]|nr:hypothetical protein HanIR_Chr15g0760551 [Helianthus annuus]
MRAIEGEKTNREQREPSSSAAGDGGGTVGIQAIYYELTSMFASASAIHLQF